VRLEKKTMILESDLNDKALYVVDIRYKQKNLDLSKYIAVKNHKILSLTPYSNYLLDALQIEYQTFHSAIVSEKDFHNAVLKDYSSINELFKGYEEYLFLFRDLASVKTFEVYLKYLYGFVENYKIVYITDIENEKLILKDDDKLILIGNQDKLFYKINNLKAFINKKDLLKKIYNKYIKKGIKLTYDNKYYSYIYNSIRAITIKNGIDRHKVYKLAKNIENSLILLSKFLYIQNQYKDICSKISSFSENSNIKFHPFTFLSKYENYKDILLYKKNNIPIIFMQHGSYLQENIFLKYNEIYPADINFVFNEYTQNLFEKRGAKKVYNVGSINFNYPIRNKEFKYDVNAKENKYDFLYIVYCTQYECIGMYVGSTINLLSVDANNIYKRHKSIIELFGKKIKNKKICVKIQSGILTGSSLYIPFLELSKNYPNITIEFSTPISELVQKSKYIISDYFSSEFINRELHYKKDIILFKGAPLPLPKETLEDMKKMFILVDTVNDLEEKVRDIENITKNRKRYDDIIEYYSSKKCNTKKMVNDILEKELNART